jgi:hypothetical protein
VVIKLLKSVASRAAARAAQAARLTRRPGAGPGTSGGGSHPLPKPPGGKHLLYAPQLDGQADPGEIVWTTVAFEDDPTQSKDRPVLVVGRDADILLGLMLSSQHSRDGQHNWLALGTGDWDRDKRPSWIRLDRVLRVPEQGIRREGAILDRTRFDKIANVLRVQYGWH